MNGNAIQSAATPLLRPLGFGELFDRAITLYLRNFLPFIGIVAALVVPLAVVQFAADTSQSGQIAAVLSQIQHPGKTVPMPLPNFSTSIILLFVLSILAFLLVYPLTFGAVAFGVGRLYVGKSVSFRESYAGALAHWPRIYGVIALVIAMAIGGYIALVLALVALFSVIAILGAAGRSATGVLIVIGILGTLVLLAIAGIAMMFITASYFAIYAVVIEGAGVGEAIAGGFSRVFNRQEWWRAILLTICAGLIALAGQFIILIVAMIAQVLGQIWLDVALKTLSSLLVYPFSIIIVVVYYFDVRIRREGYDLEAKLLQLRADQPA
jgi:hypothetical protein